MAAEQVEAVVEDPWEESRPKRLSPSRAADFMQCPRLYAAKVVDKIPDPPTAAQAKGVLVHQVLEDLYGWPVPHRTLANAQAYLAQAWAKVTDPEEHRDYLDYMEAWGYTEDRMFAEAAGLLEVYFTLEDPMALPEGATQQEWPFVEVIAGVPVKGFVDRIDTAPGGALRVVDFKSGRRPKPRYRDKALWQLRFYAWVLWRTTGRLPARVRLVYLGSEPGLIEHDPTEADTLQFEEDAVALWDAIQSAYDRNEWPAEPSPLCGWCPLRDTCPDARL